MTRFTFEDEVRRRESVLYTELTCELERLERAKQTAEAVQPEDRAYQKALRAHAAYYEACLFQAVRLRHAWEWMKRKAIRPRSEELPWTAPPAWQTMPTAQLAKTCDQLQAMRLDREAHGGLSAADRAVQSFVEAVQRAKRRAA